MSEIHSPYRADFTVLDTEEFKKLEALKAEVTALREALDWYSDSDNYKHPALLRPRTAELIVTEPTAIELDRGHRARVALGIV